MQNTLCRKIRLIPNLCASAHFFGIDDACGKSYFLFYLFHDHLLNSDVLKKTENHIIEVALDEYGNKAQCASDVMLQLKFFYLM